MPLDPSILDDLHEVRTQLVTIEGKIADALAEQPPPATDEWADQVNWADRVSWIERQAGVKSAALTTITAANVPAGCRLQGSTLYMDTATLLEDVAFNGTISPTTASGADIVLRNVVAQDLFAASQAWRVSLVEDCTFTIPQSRVTAGWGQGCLNALKAGFLVRRTLLQGGADGAQVSGGGAFEDSVIRALTITGSTHNDFVQNYGGLVTMDRCLMQQLDAPKDHLNGVFCDGGSFDLMYCAVIVTAAPGTNAFALHAAKSGTIVADSSYVRGRKVGAVTLSSTVDYAAGY